MLHPFEVTPGFIYEMPLHSQGKKVIWPQPGLHWWVLCLSRLHPQPCLHTVLWYALSLASTRWVLCPNRLHPVLWSDPSLASTWWVLWPVLWSTSFSAHSLIRYLRHCTNIIAPLPPRWGGGGRVWQGEGNRRSASQLRIEVFFCFSHNLHEIVWYMEMWNEFTVDSNCPNF